MKNLLREFAIIYFLVALWAGFDHSLIVHRSLAYTFFQLIVYSLALMVVWRSFWIAFIRPTTQFLIQQLINLLWRIRKKPGIPVTGRLERGQGSSCD